MNRYLSPRALCIIASLGAPRSAADRRRSLGPSRRCKPSHTRHQYTFSAKF